MSKSDRLEIQKAKIRKAFQFEKKPKNNIKTTDTIKSNNSIKINIAEKIKTFAKNMNNKQVKSTVQTKKPTRRWTLGQNKEEMPTY